MQYLFVKHRVEWCATCVYRGQQFGFFARFMRISPTRAKRTNKRNLLLVQCCFLVPEGFISVRCPTKNYTRFYFLVLNGHQNKVVLFFCEQEKRQHFNFCSCLSINSYKIIKSTSPKSNKLLTIFFIFTKENSYFVGAKLHC